MCILDMTVARPKETEDDVRPHISKPVYALSDQQGAGWICYAWIRAASPWYALLLSLPISLHEFFVAFPPNPILCLADHCPSLRSQQPRQCIRVSTS